MAGKKKASKKVLGKGKKLTKKQTLSRRGVIIE
jgi:hypothetical protein